MITTKTQKKVLPCTRLQTSQDFSTLLEIPFLFLTQSSKEKQRDSLLKSPPSIFKQNMQNILHYSATVSTNVVLHCTISLSIQKDTLMALSRKWLFSMRHEVSYFHKVDGLHAKLNAKTGKYFRSTDVPTNVYINVIIDFGIKFGIPFINSISKKKLGLLWKLLRRLHMVIL